MITNAARHTPLMVFASPMRQRILAQREAHGKRNDVLFVEKHHLFVVVEVGTDEGVAALDVFVEVGQSAFLEHP